MEILHTASSHRSVEAATHHPAANAVRRSHGTGSSDDGSCSARPATATAIAQQQPRRPSRRQPVVTPRKPRKPFPKPDAAAQARVAAQIARLKEITENALANQPQPLRRSVQATPDR